MRFRKILAAAALIAALAPLAAAARAACCLPKPARHACCAAGKAAPQGMDTRGCCKAPEAPVPDTSSHDRSPLGVVATCGAVLSFATAAGALPAAPAARLARLGSRAPAPDVSPPDLLARYATLLI